MGDTRKRQLMLASLVVAACALTALAIGLGGITLQPGRPLRLGAPELGAGGGEARGGFDVRLLFAGTVWVLLIVSAVGLLVSASLRRYLLRMLPLYLIYGLLAYLLFTNLRPAVGERTGEGNAPALGEGGPPPQLPELPPLEPPAYIANPPQWLVLAVSLALGVAVVGALWLAVSRARRKRPESAVAQIAREARSALADLEAGAGLRNAVLRCYAEMSRVLSGQRGVRRDKTMTPREFEGQLAAAGLRDEHIRRLTRLFESIRYGPREPGEREEREAVECLQAIVETYGTPRGGG